MVGLGMESSLLWKCVQCIVHSTSDIWVDGNHQNSNPLFENAKSMVNN